MARIIAALILISIIARAQAFEAPDGPSRLAEPRRLLRQGEAFQAVRVLRALESSAPRDGETVLLLAYAYWFAGQKRLFAAKAAVAAELLPSSPVPHYAIGRYWLDVRQQPSTAAGEFTRALARDPGHSLSRAHLGYCLELEGRSSEAAIEYRRANNAMAFAGLARLALGDGDTSRALAEARAAVRLDPNNAENRALLGRIFLQQNRLTEALREFQAAAAADPNEPKYYYQLSQCARKAGNNALARESLAKYRERQSLYAGENQDSPPASKPLQ